jgi:hypothetical protein
MSKTIIWRTIKVNIEFLVESKRDHDDLVATINELVADSNCTSSQILTTTGAAKDDSGPRMYRLEDQ